MALRRRLFYSTAVAALMISAGGGGTLVGTEGASLLVNGEVDGFSIDATSYDTITDVAYVGGPVGGTVSVGTSGTFSSDNVALDSSILTQAGTSPKMVHFNEAPFVRWTPHNLSTYSEDLSNWDGAGGGNGVLTSNDTTAPDGTVTADELSASGSNTFWKGTAVTLVANTVYTISAYAKKSAIDDWFHLGISDFSAHDFGAYFNINTGAVGGSETFGSGVYISHAITSVGSGWYRCEVVGSLPVASASITPHISPSDGSDSATTNAAVWVWGVQINRGYVATPYLATVASTRIGIPQAYDAYEDCFGILVEPAATNLLLRSEEFDNASWGDDTTTTQTANATTAPDGNTTADKLVETADVESHYLYQSITVSTTTAYTWSIYAKAGERNWLDLIANDGTDHSTWFNLSTGSIGTNSSGNTSTITAVGDGWYRCTVSRTTGAGTSGGMTLLMATADNETTYDGDGTSGLYIWGAQIELGTVATSYIPTLGSTVTRAKDIVSLPLASTPCSATKGTVYADAKMRYAGTNGDVWAFFKDSNNYHGVYTDATNWRFYSSSGSLDVHGTLNATLYDTRLQITYAFATNDFDASQDGSAVVSDGAGNFTDFTANTMYLAYDGGAGAAASPTTIYRIAYVPRQVQTEG
jgi:hypothetical protein